MKMRSLFLAVAILAAIPVVVDATIQQQRAQITVTITVEVTPAPLALRRGPENRTGTGIAARISAWMPAVGAHFHAENLTFVPSGAVAQSSNQQKAVEVRASISPNPTGTLLTSENCQGGSGFCGAVQVPATAGTTTTVTCAYQVTVDTTETSWTLDHGLYTDFESESNVVTFPGTDAENNSYLSTPHPAYTPFVVYSDSGSWVLLSTGSGTKTFCVSLQITVPASVAQGDYSSNATYTLLY